MIHSEESQNYNNLPMKMKLGEYIFIDVQIIRLQEILKLVFLLLETQTNMTPDVHGCFSQHGWKDCSICING
jgi:hypothetical protein